MTSKKLKYAIEENLVMGSIFTPLPESVEVLRKFLFNTVCSS